MIISEEFTGEEAINLFRKAKEFPVSLNLDEMTLLVRVLENQRRQCESREYATEAALSGIYGHIAHKIDNLFRDIFAQELEASRKNIEAKP